MHPLILIAAGIALSIAAGIVVLLRAFSTTALSYAESFDRADVSWRDYPFSRLLDPGDFEFLRSRGISEDRIRKLRHERRKILRLCLRSVARDFKRMHVALKLAMVHSRVDRPELATFLATQKLAFYRNLVRVEAALVLHAVGFDRMPSIDLLLPLEAMQAQLRELTAMPAMAGAAV